MAKNDLAALRVGIGTGVAWVVAVGAGSAPHLSIDEWFALLLFAGIFLGGLIGAGITGLTLFYLDTKDKAEYESEVEKKRKAKETEEYLKKEAGL